MIAVATPAMLPVPIDAPSAVMNAWNGESGPDAPRASGVSIARAASRKRPICTTPSRSVRKMPPPSSTATMYRQKEPVGERLNGGRQRSHG